MPTPREKKEDPKSLETRFGLVMYGGVSLAIYINGVAREFFRAVRGAGVYKLVKALTDRDVVVDVISGTSAGGINGIMLGYALCNQRDFASCASLWRLDGDVRSLLRSPHLDADTAESLFDSEGFYQPRLEAAFREMPDYVEEEGELNSPFPELDLFVTGTDVDGQISTQFDDAGHPIDVKDHRSVFLLKHREGRKMPFKPGWSVSGSSSPEVTYKALAKLARITSCFPAAFTPVHVGGDEPPGDETEDGKLQLWGSLGKESCFLDGGVIDNKPFTYTIREIFNRSADRQVERKLFYVEPDPEHFKAPEVASRPNFVQAVIASLIGIPGYESIADDLRLLAKHNSKVRQYQRLRANLERASNGKGNGKPPAPTLRGQELYERCSLIALSERFVEGILKVQGKAELLNRKDRETAAALIRSFDAVQERLRNVTCEDEESPSDRVPAILSNFNVYYRQRRLYRTVYKIAEVLRGKQRTPETEGEIRRLTNLWRVLNRQIELFEILRVNMERLIDDAPIRWREDVSGADNAEKQQAEAELVWYIVTESLHRLISKESRTAKLLEPAFDAVLKEVAAGKDDPKLRLEGFDRATLTAVHETFKQDANRIIEEINLDKIRAFVKEHLATLDEKSKNFKGILQLAREFEEQIINELLPPLDSSEPLHARPKNLKHGGPPPPPAPDEQEKALRRAAEQAARDRRAVRSAYFDFSDFDAQMFPIEFVGELYEKDVIETIRISPLDAGRGFSNKGLSDKVSGDALYHFAGFFKRSWRANDILWGRLDSLCQLTESLLTEARIKEIIGNPMLLERVRARFFQNPEEAGRGKPVWVDAMRPARLFPHAGQPTQEVLVKWLEGLLWKAEPEFDAEDFNRTKIARIVEAAQLEVLYEDLPGVITDSLAEQARWNQFRYPPGARGKSKGKSNGRPVGQREEEDDPARYWPVYDHSPGALDPYVSVLAAAGSAHDAIRRFELQSASEKPDTPLKTGLGKYFVNQYNIGSEELLRDMPPLVLLEILSVSLLVVRNCLLKVLGTQAERIRSHPLYLFGVDLPLRAFHTLVVFMRRVPGSRRWLPKALGLLSLLLLAIGVVWWKPIVWSGEGLNPLWFALFIAGPLVVLTTWLIYLYWGKVSRFVWLRWVVIAALTVFVLAPFFIIFPTYFAVHEAATSAVQGIYLGWFDWVRAWRPFSWLAGRGWSKPLADYTFLLMVLTPFVCALGAPLIFGRLRSMYRSSSKNLRNVLKEHFTISEMLAVASRLDLFDAKKVDALARELGVLGVEDGNRLDARFGERLGETRAELRRKFGLRDNEQIEEHQEGEVKKRSLFSYDELISLFNKHERQRKRAAYDELALKLREQEQQQQEALAEGMQKAACAAPEDAYEAVRQLVAREREFEALKAKLASEAIEKAQETDRAVEAGHRLADELVNAAEAADNRRRLVKRIKRRLPEWLLETDAPKRRPGKSGEPEKMLTRLERAMYSINPGAMS